MSNGPCEVEALLPNLASGFLFDSLDLWDGLAIGLVLFAFVCIYRLPARVLSEGGNLLNDLSQRAASISGQLEGLTDGLGEIENAAGRVHERVEKLDRRLQAEAITDKRRSTIQALLGTLIGLVGGFFASWVEAGGALFPDQLVRAVIVGLVGLLTLAVAVLVAPPTVDWTLGVVERVRRRLPF